MGDWTWQDVLELKVTEVEGLQHEVVELRDARAAEEAKRANAELEVARLLGVVEQERREARARVAALESVLAEPSEEEADRLVVLAFDASVAAMGDRSRHPNEPSRAAMRAILADLRQRAGVTS